MGFAGRRLARNAANNGSEIMVLVAHVSEARKSALPNSPKEEGVHNYRRRVKLDFPIFAQLTHEQIGIRCWAV